MIGPRNSDMVQAELDDARGRVAALQAELATALTPAAILATLPQYGVISLRVVNSKIEISTPLGVLGQFAPASARQGLAAWFQAQGDTGGGGK